MEKNAHRYCSCCGFEQTKLCGFRVGYNGYYWECEGCQSTLFILSETFRQRLEAFRKERRNDDSRS